MHCSFCEGKGGGREGEEGGEREGGRGEGRRGEGRRGEGRRGGERGGGGRERKEEGRRARVKESKQRVNILPEVVAQEYPIHHRCKGHDINKIRQNSQTTESKTQNSHIIDTSTRDRSKSYQIPAFPETGLSLPVNHRKLPTACKMFTSERNRA